jgi:NAD(P)-dependent dehydrogenase (short-subunit alcohol dehydrogenase family)
MTHPLDLTGKVALVTGGNSGIGFAAASALARAGAAVSIWGRDADRNTSAVDALRMIGPAVHVAQVDVADPDQIDAAFADVLVQLGRVDCVVANAGNMVPARGFLDITPEMRAREFRTFLRGSWQTIVPGVRHMVARAELGDPGGSIVVTGSLTARHGYPGAQHFGAAKAALVAMVKGIAVEFGPYGIRANVIHPGYIAKDDDALPFARQLETRSPIPRYGMPAEIAGAIVYLASDAAAYHTGDELTIDGGWTSTLL